MAPVAAHHWASGAAELQRPDNPHGQDLLMGGGAAPSPGDIIKMPHLAQTFRVCHHPPPVCTMPPQLLYIVSHLMNNAVLRTWFT